MTDKSEIEECERKFRSAIESVAKDFGLKMSDWGVSRGTRRTYLNEIGGERLAVFFFEWNGGRKRFFSGKLPLDAILRLKEAVDEYSEKENAFYEELDRQERAQGGF